jgi:multimeric flavodoxin WrbA
VLKDALGIETSIGAGSRIARAAQIHAMGKGQRGGPPPRFDFWILQDRKRMTETLIQPLVSVLNREDLPSSRYHFCDYLLQPCKACDRCPNRKEGHSAYACRMHTSHDEFNVWHGLLVRADVVVPTIYSPVDRTHLASAYQRFLERTRYLRRSDYLLSNRVVIPLIFCEIGRNEHLDLRLISSFIRHNTIVHKPLVGLILKGQLIDPAALVEDWKMAIKTSARLVAGRYQMENHAEQPKYVPLGY